MSYIFYFQPTVFFIFSEQCYLTTAQITKIKTGCDGFSTCIPQIQLPQTCMIDESYLNLTYVCTGKFNI